jgi:hypothetical protein
MKPTVFLSHSSKDANILNSLKERLQQKTGGTLELFLSSDGQSIPFGRNWISTVEGALQKSTLMFTFLSPRSVSSSWLYFEAGFASARGADVVPIAIGSIDLASTPPPISLLQGFNLRDEGGLNNLLSIINRRFDFAFPLSFSAIDYSEIFGVISDDHGLGGAPFLESVVISIEALNDEATLVGVLERSSLGSLHVTEFLENEMIVACGLHVRTKKFRKQTGDEIFYEYQFDLSPELLHLTLPACQAFVDCCASASVKLTRFRLGPNVMRTCPVHTMAARLHGSPITLRSDGKFMMAGIPFEISSPTFYTERSSAVDLEFYDDRRVHPLPYGQIIQALIRHNLVQRVKSTSDSFSES